MNNNGNPARAAWLRDAKYGFFLHHIDAASREQWNEVTERFDVGGMARAFRRMGGGYAFLTTGQNSGYYCSPNRTYDSILGNTPGTTKCSRRDLVFDFLLALEAENLAGLAYTTSLGPAHDREACRALKNIPPWRTENAGNYDEVKDLADTDPRLRYFLRRWEAIHREWALRWGRHCRGWWVDGCYHNSELHRHPDEPNGASWAAALRAGNPDAAVAFNMGVEYPPKKLNDVEDYTAGESNEPWRSVTAGPLIDGLQYQVLTYAGQTWGAPPLRFDAGELAAITRAINGNGGAVTWDLPWDFGTGKLPAETVERFVEMKSILDGTPEFRTFSFSVPVKPSARETGKIRLVCDTTAPIEFDWNGTTIAAAGQTEYEFKLAPSHGMENRAGLRWGKFHRTFPVPLCKKIRTGENFVIRTDDGAEIGRFRVERDGAELRLTAEAGEPVPRIAPVCWRGSCFELFFTVAGTDAPRQLILTPDGKLWSRQDGLWREDGMKKEFRRTAAGYALSLPLPAGFNRFEIQLTVLRNGILAKAVAGRSSNAFNVEEYMELLD